MRRIDAPSVGTLVKLFGCLLFLYLFALNSFTPLWGDDWWRAVPLQEAAFWKTGAIGYLWVLTAAVYVITPFVDLLVDEEPQDGTRWEIVAQTTAGPRILASGALDPADGAPQVLHDEFTVTPELEEAPIEFRIAPADRERVELFRFSIVSR